MVSKTRRNSKKKHALKLKKSRRHRLKKRIGGGEAEYDAYKSFLRGYHEPKFNKHVSSMGKDQPAAPVYSNSPYRNIPALSIQYNNLQNALNNEDKEQLRTYFHNEVGHTIGVYVPYDLNDPSIKVQPIFYAEEYMEALSKASDKNFNEIFRILSTGGEHTPEQKEIIKIAFGKAHDYIYDLDGATTNIGERYRQIVAGL